MSEETAAARALLARLPRADLGFFPTPLYKLERLSARLGVQVYIKRDDFTGMSLFGGNKVRKLSYLLGKAAKEGAQCAITYGATQSNHAMETACACRRLGMRPILYLTAVVPPREDDVRANLLLDKVLGAEIHIVPIGAGETEADAEERSFRMGAQRAEELTASGCPCVDIPMGGANPLGSVGFAEGMVEMAEQQEALGVRFTRLYHSTGTGGTMAGLHAGRAMLGLDVDIRSVAASEKQREAYLSKVEGLTRQVLSLLGSDAVLHPEDLHVDLTQWQPGYEQPSENASRAIRLLAREEGLFVDPVYTGKALAALLRDVETGDVRPGEQVLFWHTGGATALFAEPQILGDLFSE